MPAVELLFLFVRVFNTNFVLFVRIFNRKFILTQVCTKVLKRKSGNN